MKTRRQAQPAGPSTRSVHAGEKHAKAGDAVATPIAQTATYSFRDTQELRDYFEGRIERSEYGRYGNPTAEVAERKLAALDGAEAACLFASGMAAVTTALFALLSKGGHAVLTDDCYRRTRQFCARFLARYGVDVTLVPPEPAAIEEAIRPNTKLILSESPTNPYLNVVDLLALADIGRRRRVKTIIDSTFATPYNQRPLEMGIDLVVHSATKYLGGHNDLLAGSVAGKCALIEGIRDLRGVLGGVADPHAAYLLLRGLKTFALRLERQNQNGQRIAEFLAGHPKVGRVYYPGLPAHPTHRIARAQMTGFGGVVSFEYKGGLDDASRFIDALEIPRIAPSLGGVESLIEQPALMSFYELTTDERLAIGIKDNLVRFAIGIEDADDLIADLSQAFDAAPVGMA